MCLVLIFTVRWALHSQPTVKDRHVKACYRDGTEYCARSIAILD
jgi:hypothetical protein